MLEAETINEPTILEYLNEYCWRAVLKYVPVQDLIRTEGTSRNLQARVLEYLQGLALSIYDDCGRPKTANLKLRKQDYESFALWTNKLGPSVVATYCYSLETMKTVRDNCPNLESLMIVDMPMTPGLEMFTYNLNKDFKRLKGLHFYSCRVSDDWINQFIADKALEELEVNRCQMLQGDFFKTINVTNLKSLTLDLQLSDGFYFESFLAVVKYLAMTEHSVVNSLCRWGKQLRSLSLENLEELMDCQVVAIISGCPELMISFVRYV